VSGDAAPLCLRPLLAPVTDTTLFRSNTTTSKLLSFYSRMAGKQYLQKVLGQVLKDFRNYGNLEVDPERLKEEDDIRANTQRLVLASAEVLNAIITSIEDCPQY